MSTKLLLFDAILLNDELDLLAFRIDALREYIDVFYVFESRLTFSGQEKPLLLKEKLHALPEAHRERIWHHEYSLDPCADRWSLERSANAQRLAVCLSLPMPAVVFLNDADEFPSESQCLKARSITRPHSVPMTTYYRRVNWEVRYSENLPMGVVTPTGLTPNQIPGEGMHQRKLPVLRGEAGSHFSYLGFRAEQLHSKSSTFSHSELDFPEASDEHLLTLADYFAVDHLGRAAWKGGGLLKFIPRSDWNHLQLMAADRMESVVAAIPPPPRWFTRLSVSVLIDRIVSKHQTEWAVFLPENPQTFWRGMPLTSKALLGLLVCVALVRRPTHGKLASLKSRLMRLLSSNELNHTSDVER